MEGCGDYATESLRYCMYFKLIRQLLKHIITKNNVEHVTTCELQAKIKTLGVTYG